MPTNRLSYYLTNVKLIMATLTMVTIELLSLGRARQTVGRVYIYIYIYVCISLSLSLSLSLSIYIYIYIYTYTYMYIYMYTYIYIYIHIYRDIHICMYTYMQKEGGRRTPKETPGRGSGCCHLLMLM